MENLELGRCSVRSRWCYSHHRQQAALFCSLAVVLLTRMSASGAVRFTLPSASGSDLFARRGVAHADVSKRRYSLRFAVSKWQCAVPSRRCCSLQCQHCAMFASSFAVSVVVRFNVSILRCSLRCSQVALFYSLPAALFAHTSARCVFLFFHRTGNSSICIWYFSKLRSHAAFVVRKLRCSVTIFHY